MKRLKYVDTYCHGAFHEMFNASLLTLCALAGERVDYIASRHTIEAVMARVKGALDLGKVRLKRIFVPAGYGHPLPVAVRYLLGVVCNMWHVLVTSSSVPLIFNYNNAFALRGMNWLARVFNRKVIVFCHGEIELLSPECKEHMGPIARCLQKRLTAFFVRKKTGFAAGLKFVVLGDSILSNLKSRVSSAAFERFCSLDHPFLFPVEEGEGATLLEDGLSVSKKEISPLKFGTIGTMKQAKGLDNFLRFLEVIHPSSVSVKIIGRLEGDQQVKKIEQRGVEIFPGGNMFLPREELERRIGELDYILYFYYSDSYRLIASGAIFDAVVARRPVLALHNDFFDYLFHKFGDFGYLELTPEAMAARAEKLVSAGDSRYSEFMDNIRKLRQALHPNALLKDFNRLLIF